MAAFGLQWNVWIVVTGMVMHVLILTTCSGTESNGTAGVTNNDANCSSANATTSTPKPVVPDLPHDQDHALFELKLTVSRENTSDITIDTNDTSVLQTSVEQIQQVLLKEASGVNLIRKNDSEITYEILVTCTISKWNAQNQTLLKNALLKLTEQGIFFNNIDGNFEQLSNLTSDQCNAVGICPPGYTCMPEGCVSYCSNKDCNGHGTCYLEIEGNTTEAKCSCDSTYDYDYYGPDCGDSRIGKDKVIAIVAGVLGTLSLILLILCICFCIRKQTGGTRGSEYALSNEAYSDSTFQNTPTKL